MAEELRLRIRFQGKDAERNLKKFNKTLGESEKQGKNARSTMDSLSLAFVGFNQALELAQKGLRAVKAGIDFAREGAQIERTRDQFDRLAREIGTTGDILENDLQVATKGMVSDMEAVTLGADFLRLGMVDTREDLLRLADAASQLDFDMNELTLTLANQSKRRLDQLGISVTVFNEKLAALEGQGLATNEAFTEAFLQAAEEQIERVGELSGTTVGHWAQLDTHIEDAQVALKTLANELVDSPLATLVAHLDDLAQKRAGLDLIADGGIDAAFAMERLGLTAGDVQGLGAQLQRLAFETGINTEQAIGYAHALGGPLVDSFGNLNPEIEDYIIRQQEANAITAQIQNEFDAAKNAINAMPEEAGVDFSFTGKDGQGPAAIVSGVADGINDSFEEHNWVFTPGVGWVLTATVNFGMGTGFDLPTLGGGATGTGGGPTGPTQSSGGGGGRPGRSGPIELASGGRLGPLSLVGERGPELIINGVVIDAGTTRRLMRLGITPDQRLAVAGSLFPGQTSGSGGGGIGPGPDIQTTNLIGSGGGATSPGASQFGGGGGGTTITSISSGGGGGSAITQQQSEQQIAQQTAQIVSTQVQAAVTSQSQQLQARFNEDRRSNQDRNALLRSIVSELTEQADAGELRDILTETRDTSRF